MNAVYLSRFLFIATAAALPATAGTDPQVIVTVPPPASQHGLSSAEVQGVVVGDPGPAPVDEVFFRTRYPDGTLCPPITNEGAWDPNALGWGYAVEWDEVNGVGTFEGRVKWMAPGTNWLDVYLPTDTLGSPSYTQSFVFQSAGIQPTDIVAITHPKQRTVDVVDSTGGAGRIDFLLDLLNTTGGQTYTVDVLATIELPDQSVVNLPMGGPGLDAATFTIGPGEFDYTGAVDPIGMRFTFPLDEAPFPQPVQEGLYHMEISVYDGPALIYFEEDIDFYVTDRTGKPFRDITQSTAFDDVHIVTTGGVGTGMSAFDYNNDGLTDLFVPNPTGTQVKVDSLQYFLPYPGANNYLLRNNGDGTFTDVTEEAGVEGSTTYRSYGSAWGDLDGDGWNDLVVSNRGFRSYIYRNNGDGTFTDVGDGAFGTTTNVWGQVPRLADVDNDGDLDLFLGTYVQLWLYTWQQDGFKNQLWRNHLVEGAEDPLVAGWPLFTDASNPSGINDTDTTLAAFFFDYDRNGTLDLAVHNDFGGFSDPNRLYSGNGDGTFVDVGSSNGYESREFSMGAVAEDFDGNGWLDVYSTSIGLNSLAFNNGNGTFTQGAKGSGADGIYITEGPQADGINLDDNWSAIGFDYDLDMDVDLYVMGSDLWTTYQCPIAEIHPDSMYENDGTGQFTQRAGDLGLDNGGRGRSAVLIDIDNDLDLDIIVSNEGEGLTVSRNDQVTSNHWLRMRPAVTRSAPGGFNSFFRVTAGGVEQVHELMASSPHNGQLDNIANFGLGANTSAEVTVEWPRGGSTTYFDLPADAEHVVYEFVIEVDGGIDADVQADTAATVRLLGEPDAFVIAAYGNPAIGTPLALPSGGSMDIFPFFSPYLFQPAFLNAAGEAPFVFFPFPQSLVGQSLDLQMVELDLNTSTYPVKSGVSTVTVVP